MSIGPYTCVAALVALPLCSPLTENEGVEQEPPPSTETAASSDDWPKVTFSKSSADVGSAGPLFNFGDAMVLPTGNVGQPLGHGPAVVLNESGVYVDGTKIVALRQGQPELPADEARAAISSALVGLFQRHAQPSRLVIFADQDLRFRSLAFVVLATEAAVPGFLLAVQDNDGKVRGLSFDRPRLAPDGKLDLSPDEGAWALDIGAFSSIRIGVRTCPYGRPPSRRRSSRARHPAIVSLRQRAEASKRPA